MWNPSNVGASPSSSSTTSSSAAAVAAAAAAAAAAANQPNQLLMKFWQCPKQTAVISSNSGKIPVSTSIPSIMRNAKIGGVGSGGGSGVQPIVNVVGYNQSNCDETANDTNELDIKLNDVHSPHHDFKSVNSSSSGGGGGVGGSGIVNVTAAAVGANNMVIGQALAPKDFGCDDTYEDGIDKDIRDLERRLESELEEHEKLWSPAEETPISQT